MSKHYQTLALVIGQANDINELHRNVLKTEARSHASQFSAEFLEIGVPDTLAVLYRSSDQKYNPQVTEVLLNPDEPDLKDLNVVSYVTAIEGNEVTTSCIDRGTLIAQNEPVDTDSDSTLGHFQDRIRRHGVDGEIFESRILHRCTPHQE